MAELTGTLCSTYEAYTKADAISQAVKYAVAGAVAAVAIYRTGRARHAWILAIPRAIEHVSEIIDRKNNQED